MAIVRVTIDDIFDMPPMTKAELEALDKAKDTYFTDCPPLTAEQLRRAVPLRVANPKLYAEIEAARERAAKKQAAKHSELQQKTENKNECFECAAENAAVMA